MSDREIQLLDTLAAYAREMRNLAEAAAEGLNWYKYNNIAKEKGTRFAIGWYQSQINKTIEELSRCTT